MFENYNEIITIEELCELLDIGRNTAYDLLRSKKLRGFKIGSKWKIPALAVERYILEKSGLNGN